MVVILESEEYQEELSRLFCDDECKKNAFGRVLKNNIGRGDEPRGETTVELGHHTYKVMYRDEGGECYSPYSIDEQIGPEL